MGRVQRSSWLGRWLQASYPVYTQAPERSGADPVSPPATVASAFTNASSTDPPSSTECRRGFTATEGGGFVDAQRPSPAWRLRRRPAAGSSTAAAAPWPRSRERAFQFSHGRSSLVDGAHLNRCIRTQGWRSTSWFCHEFELNGTWELDLPVMALPTSRFW